MTPEQIRRLGWAGHAELAERLDEILEELKRQRGALPTESLVEHAWSAEDRLHKAECDLLQERKRAEKAEAEARDLAERLDATETIMRVLDSKLCDLVAVVHRDGGQRTGTVGLHQSCSEAQEIIAKSHSELDELKAQVQALEAELKAWRRTAEKLANELDTAAEARDLARDSARWWREFAFSKTDTGLDRAGTQAWISERDRLAAEEDARK